MRRLMICAALLNTLTTGCMAAPEKPSTPAATGGISPTAPKTVPVPDSAPATAISGEVPADIIAKIRSDLTRRTGADASKAKLVTAESVQWPNGALGCPEPGAFYTQAIVPGYRVVLELAGRSYTYHASQKAQFKYCPNPSPVGGVDTN